MRKYTLKRQDPLPTSPAEIPSPVSEMPAQNRRKAMLYILAVLCIGLLVTSGYFYNQTRALRSDKAELQSQLKQCNAELSNNKAALMESKKEVLAYKQLKDYYMPYEKLYNDLYEQVYPNEPDPGMTIDPYHGDLGLYQKYDKNGNVVLSDEQVELVEENREKGINPAN